MAMGGSCLGVTATKFIAEYRREHERERISSIYFVTNGFAVVMAVLLALAMYFFANPLACVYLRAPEMTEPLQVASFIVFVVVINIAQEGVITGFEDFKGRAVVQVAGGLVQACAMVVGSWYWGLKGGIVGFGLGFLCIAVLNKIIINRNMRWEKVALDWHHVVSSDLKLLYQFSLPTLLMALLSTPVFFVVRVLMKRYGDFSVMADFDVSYQWFMLILFVPNAVGTMILPILSSLNTDHAQFHKVQNISLLVNGGVALAVALILALCSNMIFSFYGKGYTNAMPLVVMSATSVFAALSAVLGYSMTSQGKIWQQLFINLIWAGALLSLSYCFLVNGQGATGAALAMLCAYVVMLVLQYGYLRLMVREKCDVN